MFNNILFSILSSSMNTHNNIKQVVFSMPSFNINFLGGPSIPPPYISDKPSKQFTLVLDLDETLIHFFYTPTGGSFMIRPYCYEFLKEMSKHFELIIFTAALKDVNFFY